MCCCPLIMNSALDSKYPKLVRHSLCIVGLAVKCEYNSICFDLFRFVPIRWQWMPLTSECMPILCISALHMLAKFSQLKQTYKAFLQYFSSVDAKSKYKNSSELQINLHSARIRCIYFISIHSIHMSAFPNHIYSLQYLLVSTSLS